jgi:hypothetical protein
MAAYILFSAALAVAGRTIGAMAEQVVGVVMALGRTFGAGASWQLQRVCGPRALLGPMARAHPACCACNHFCQLSNKAVGRVVADILNI